MNTVEVIGLIGVTFILVRGTIFNAVRTKIAEWKQANGRNNILRYFGLR